MVIPSFFLKYLSYLFPCLFLELQGGALCKNYGLISVAREDGRKKL